MKKVYRKPAEKSSLSKRAAQSGVFRLLEYILSQARDGYWVCNKTTGEIASEVGISRSYLYRALYILQRERFIVYFARNGSNRGVKIRILRHRRVFRDLSTTNKVFNKEYKTYIKTLDKSRVTGITLDDFFKRQSLGRVSRTTFSDYLRDRELAKSVRIEKHWRFYREFMTQVRLIASSTFGESVSNICEGVVGELAHRSTLYEANLYFARILRFKRDIRRRSKRYSGKALWLFIRVIALGKLPESKKLLVQNAWRRPRREYTCRLCGGSLREGHVEGVCWNCYESQLRGERKSIQDENVLHSLERYCRLCGGSLREGHVEGICWNCYESQLRGERKSIQDENTLQSLERGCRLCGGSIREGHIEGLCFTCYRENLQEDTPRVENIIQRPEYVAY